MHGNLNHIGCFVAHVEQTYHKQFSTYNGSGAAWLRPVAMYVVYKLSGINMRKIARHFRCDIGNVWLAIHRAKEYERYRDEKFIYHYNKLLDLYISSTRFYIRKRKFIQ